MPEELSIDIVSDVVCPWCYLGKRRLDAALREAGDVTVRWLPFQLDPGIPPGGHDRTVYMRAKFPEPGRLEAAHELLTALGREAGIAFDFARIRRAPNTLDAHRLIRFASEAGLADALVERLFSDYFERGRDIGDREVLSRAGQDCGVADVGARLATAEGVDEVRAEIEAAQRMGVEGVPFFIFADRYAVSGAQGSDVLAEAMRQARAA